MTPQCDPAVQRAQRAGFPHQPQARGFGWTSNLFASVVDDGNAFGSVPTVDDIRGLLA